MTSHAAAATVPAVQAGDGIVLERAVDGARIAAAARISHTYSAAGADLLANSGRTRKSLLDILSSMPSSTFASRGPILRHLDALATNTCEKCGPGVRRWPIYTSAADGFDHVFGDRDTCYVIEGEAHVTPAGGETFVFRAGDLATFPRGTRVYWEMPARFRKHYRFG